MAIRKVSVQLKNLTPHELRETILPDDYFHAALVQFTSEIGNPYWVLHINQPEPYISFIDFAEDETDFEYVKKVIKQETGGKSREPATDVYEGTAIYLSGKPTQSRVATWVEGYTRYFNEVTVLEVHFHDVPLPTIFYKKSGLLPDGSRHFV